MSRSERANRAVMGEQRQSDIVQRSTEAVVDDHVRLRTEGRLEDDLARNYAPDVVLLTENSALQGHDAIRRSASRLHDQLRGARYTFTARQVWGECALLVWRAEGPRFRVECGADTFRVSGGKIQMQSIHYNLIPTG